jgi:hypothetical protein
MAWDSNIFSSRDNIVADRIQIIRPGLTISTLDPNYKFTLTTFLQRFEHDVSPDDSRTDAGVELKGTIRAQRNLDVNVGISAGRVTSPRSDVQRRDLPTDAAEPIALNHYSAWAGLRRDLNPVISTTTVTVEKDNYFNVRSTAGSTINLQYLDRESANVAQETDLRLSHRLLLFSRQRASMITYRDEPGFTQDDFVRFETVNGIQVGFTPLITGKFSFHFAEDHFWNTAINADPERAYAFDLAWSPARNIRLRAGVKRDFGGVSIALDSSGGRRTHADAAIEYDITRQLFFRATFTHLHANEASLISGEQRIENSQTYAASLGYQMNRFWSLVLDYAYERRDAVDETSEFKRHIVQTGVIARF